MRKIDSIYIHCSASDDNADIGAAEIRYLHAGPTSESVDWYGYQTHCRGWSDIGYHFVIRRGGKTESGRPIIRVGAHVAGLNRTSIGIVWVGRDQITEDQINTLIRLVLNLMSQYNIPKHMVKGHYEVDKKKTCPNIDMDYFRDLLGTV